MQVISKFIFLVSSGITAMSCYTSYSYDLREKLKGTRYHHFYGWTYGFGWASVGIALIGSLVSVIDLFKLPRDVENPAIEIS